MRLVSRRVLHALLCAVIGVSIWLGIQPPSSIAGTGQAGPTLGAIPQNCPSGPSPQQFTPSLGPGIGNDLVRLTFFGPTETGTFLKVHLGRHLHHGWFEKMIWFLQPGSTTTIRVRGWNLRTGKPIVEQIKGYPDQPVRYATSVTLGPHPAATEPGGWMDAGGSHGYFFPTAGCYVLFVQWKSGAMLLPFAAGR